MTNYWDLYNELSRLAHTGALAWREVDQRAHAHQVSMPWNVLRQFEAPLTFCGRPATLLCSEKRIFVDEDYLFPFEDITCELRILDNEEVLEEITEPLIPWYILRGFVGAVAAASNRVAMPQHA